MSNDYIKARYWERYGYGRGDMRRYEEIGRIAELELLARELAEALRRSDSTLSYIVARAGISWVPRPGFNLTKDEVDRRIIGESRKALARYDAMKGES